MGLGPVRSPSFDRWAVGPGLPSSSRSAPAPGAVRRRGNESGSSGCDLEASHTVHRGGVDRRVCRLSNAALDRAARRSRPPSTEDALDAFRERWFSIQYTLDGIRGHMDAVMECVVTDHRRVLGIGRRLPPHTGLAAASTLVPGWRLPGPRLSGETLRSRSPSPTLVPGRAHPSGQSDLVVWLPPPVRPRAWVEDRDRPRWASSVPETRR